MARLSDAAPDPYGFREVIHAYEDAQAKLKNREPWMDYRPRNPGAEEEELLAAEARIGFPLDPQYRSFLRLANGWHGFNNHDVILGTEELGQGQYWAESERTWDQAQSEFGGIVAATEFGEAVLSDYCGAYVPFCPGDVLTCAMSTNVYPVTACLWLPGPHTSDGALVLRIDRIVAEETYTNFREYLLSHLDLIY